MLGIIEERREHRAEQMADPWIGVDSADLECMVDTDVPCQECIADRWMGIEQPSELAIATDGGIGRVARRPQVRSGGR